VARGPRSASRKTDGTMPLYNVYAEEYGRMSRIYSFNANDDEEAKAFVMDRLTEKPVELWRFSNRVACIDGKQPG